MGELFDEPVLRAVTVLALGAAVHVGAALSFARSGPRRVVCWALACAAPFVTYLAPADLTIWRFVIVLPGVLCLFHIIDLHRDRRELTPGLRVWFVLTPFDTRKTRRVPRELRPRLVLTILGWGLVSFASFWSLFHPPALAGLPGPLVRWATGMVTFYSTVEVVGAGIEQLYLLGGIQTPLLHRNPALARSVQEFWGERWNLEIRRWLYLHTFLPLARRRRMALGVLAAFGASTLLHIWVVLPSTDWRMAGLWAIFFFSQGLIILVERRLEVARWPRPLAHAWTVSMLLGTSPLFAEPMLRVISV